MRTIWKFALEMVDSQKISMPRDARILSAQIQGGTGTLCLWAEVIPGRAQRLRTIEIHGTGHDLADDAELQFIGTVQLYEGGLVFHVFELVSEVPR